MLELSKERSRDVSFDYLSFAESCLNVCTKEDFIKAVNIANNLFEFKKAVCCIGRRKNADHLEITELVNVSFPGEWLKIYLDKNLQDVDPIVINHFKHFKPQMWTKTRKKTPYIDWEFITLVKDFGLEDGVSHGVYDWQNSKGSLFSFSGVPVKEQCYAEKVLQIIIPIFHIALLNLLKKEQTTLIVDERKKYLPLTDREKEVLNWMKIGKTNWEISLILGVSERTVKFHVKNILSKLNTTTRTYAVAKAIHLSIISL
jgi:DNA-binding CsgD family transcriptional regulator